MVWFKVDDNVTFHQKVMAAGNAAMGLWTRAGGWCAHQLSDGYVPAAMAEAIGTAEEIAALVAVGLWTTADGGYQFWQWDERNPLRADVEGKREKRSAAGRVGGQRSAESRSKTEASAEANRQANRQASAEANRQANAQTMFQPPSRPVPTHTELSLRSSSGRQPELLAVRDPEPAPETTTGGTILSEYLERCQRRPPAKVIGQLGKLIKEMLSEGIDPDDVRRGMAAWHSKGLHPSTLPSVVNEVMNAPPAGQRPSTADQRFAQGMALAAEYERRGM